MCNFCGNYSFNILRGIWRTLQWKSACVWEREMGMSVCLFPLFVICVSKHISAGIGYLDKIHQSKRCVIKKLSVYGTLTWFLCFYASKNNKFSFQNPSVVQPIILWKYSKGKNSLFSLCGHVHTFLPMSLFPFLCCFCVLYINMCAHFTYLSLCVNMWVFFLNVCIFMRMSKKWFLFLG